MSLLHGLEKSLADLFIFGSTITFCIGFIRARKVWGFYIRLIELGYVGWYGLIFLRLSWLVTRDVFAIRTLLEEGAEGVKKGQKTTICGHTIQTSMIPCIYKVYSLFIFAHSPNPNPKVW